MKQILNPSTMEIILIKIQQLIENRLNKTQALTK